VSETDELYIGLAMIHLERNEIEHATELLQHIEANSASRVHQGNRHRWCVAMSRVAHATGDFPRAIELLDEADREDRRDPVPRVRPTGALRARVAVALNDIDGAMRWASENALTVNDELTFLREYEHLVFARVLLAKHRVEGDRDALASASLLLERLSVAARSGGRHAHAVEIAVLQSLTCDAGGRDRAAVDAMNAALALAEPAGIIRAFVDEGRTVRELLRQPAVRAGHGSFAKRILVALAMEADGEGVAVEARPVELLTKRELEILRFIAAGMRNEDIATHLFISPSTAKRHIANIYAKLDAHHRTEALNRAAELSLL
jgi:LuxR family maltose regulon positive regulatory protein